MTDIETLDQAIQGQRCRVCALSGLSEGVSRRLACLGFGPGADVEVVRRAPWGDPTVYRVGGAEICLRRSESRAVLVRPCVDADDPRHVTVSAA